MIVVKSTAQALEYLKKHEAELILMDNDIPDPGGLDEVKLIRNHLKDISQDEITSLVKDYFGEGC